MTVKLNSAFKAATLAASICSLAACATPGQESRADVYTADQVNSRQAAKVVEIMAVLPAKVQVDNSQNQRTAQIAGGILGAALGAGLGGGLSHQAGVGLLAGAGGAGAGVAAGSLVSATALVEGVSLTYRENGQIFNSAQVGRACEYKPGQAIMVQTNADSTRIQPNAACPVPATKA